MDSKKSALIFGYNKYSDEIIHNLKDKYENIQLYILEEIVDQELPIEDVKLFDLSDNWEDIASMIDPKESMAFCVLESTAENIFLTISLRAHFEDLTIIAIASNSESANKLKMAGANKVIPLVETTSDIITNMLQKPVSNKVLHAILYEESDLKIAQIKIDEHSNFKDENIASIDWTRYNGIIVLSVMHKDMRSEFIYSAEMREHIIQPGDILVIVGYEEDIKAFEKKIGSKRYVNWSHWSW